METIHVWLLGLEDCVTMGVVYICYLSYGGKGQNCQVKFFFFGGGGGVNFPKFHIIEEL